MDGACGMDVWVSTQKLQGVHIMAVKINISRFYRQELLDIQCEIITPMFLGNANQEAELRSAPFKGLLRYWWRVAQGRRYNDYTDLLNAEKRIFGSADDQGGKSRVILSVEPVTALKTSRKGFGFIKNVRHPECEKTPGETNPLNYLAGMGLIHYKDGIKHSYFPVGERFKLRITATNDTAEDVNRALNLFANFAAAGSRSRNAWGCINMTGVRYCVPELVDWEDAMNVDYPHCLGRDQDGALLWKTRQLHGDWKNCMRELAEKYIAVRLAFPMTGKEPHAEQQDRHILGYPLTNHNVVHKNKKLNWGTQNKRGKCKPTRHSSALRLFVRKEENGYRGYFLHIPHAFSQQMWPDDRKRQIQIWQKVHQTLDNLCQRVPNGEVV